MSGTGEVPRLAVGDHLSLRLEDHTGPMVEVMRLTARAVQVRPISGPYRPFVWFPLKSLTRSGNGVQVAWWMKKKLTANQRFVLGEV